MLKQGLRIWRILLRLGIHWLRLGIATTNPLAILGTLRNGLGDRWHIAAGTEK
jgi:hypothetical protein